MSIWDNIRHKAAIFLSIKLYDMCKIVYQLYIQNIYQNLKPLSEFQ